MTKPPKPKPVPYPFGNDLTDLIVFAHVADSGCKIAITLTRCPYAKIRRHRRYR